MLTDNVAVTSPEEAEERLISPAPVLITEQQIALATAAALRPHPEPRRRWRRVSVPLMRGGLPKGRDYPKRYGFLEDACMAREMLHL
jgi:hypothetical protein